MTLEFWLREKNFSGQLKWRFFDRQFQGQIKGLFLLVVSAGHFTGLLNGPLSGSQVPLFGLTFWGVHILRINFLTMKFTYNAIFNNPILTMQKFHCKTISQKILLKNFIVKQFHKKYC